MKAGLLLESPFPSNANLLAPYDILETTGEEDYDNFSKLASHIFRTPISLISLIDNNRLWFKSKIGVKAQELPLEFTLCKETIQTKSGIMVVCDASKDDRWSKHPLVVGPPFLRFYAGAAIIDAEGNRLGTICVIDTNPREVNLEDLQCLRILSKNVMELLSKRKLEKKLNEKLKLSQKRAESMQRFAMFTAHDLKSPLQNIQSLSKKLLQDINMPANHKTEFIDHIHQSSGLLLEFIHNLLGTNIGVDSNNNQLNHLISTSKFEHTLNTIYGSNPNVELNLITGITTLKLPVYPLIQIMNNIISNSIKHFSKTGKCIINISIEAFTDKYKIIVEDNGGGFKNPDKLHLSMSSKSNMGNKKIGLNIIQFWIDELEGTCEFYNVADGAAVAIQIPKSE